MPGCGTGYLPSASDGTGGGESIVSLSTSGANSCWQLRISSKVMIWPVWAAMRPIEVTRLASAPSLHFVVGLVLADRLDQVVPFQLVRVRFRLRERPQPVVFREVLSLEGADLARRVRRGRDDRRALRAVGVAGELVVAAGHVPAVVEELGAVGIGVFDGVGVEVLVDGIAAVVAAAEAWALTGQAPFIHEHSSIWWM